MDYLQSFYILDEMICKSKRGEQVNVSEDGRRALEEGKIAISRLIGEYPDIYERSDRYKA